MMDVELIIVIPYKQGNVFCDMAHECNHVYLFILHMLIHANFSGFYWTSWYYILKGHVLLLIEK
jgi:hypothetical protein